MTSLTERTHRSLIKPIEPINNLANITAREPSKTCQSCAAIIPDRRKCVKGLIKINYERIDLYPDFPELKASAYAGCGFCKYIRKTIRAKWAVRPMEEWGVGPLREKEGLWEDFFTAPWDCKVKIHNLLFSLDKESDTSPVPLDVMTSTEEDDYPGMVISFGFEFGLATLLTSSDGASLYGEIGQRIGFKVFDSQGGLASSSGCIITNDCVKILTQAIKFINEGSLGLRLYQKQISCLCLAGLMNARIRTPSAV